MSLLPTVIPFSTLFIFSLAAGISFLTSLANRLLTKPEQMKAWRKEIAEWQAALRKAQKEKDEKLMDKVMKKQKHILQLQSKMSWQQMKVSLLFIIPLILIWQFLGGTYSTPTGPLPIAYFPGVGP
ncbi:MAG: EMC3/TMCO1 family protein, partial [Candidatus Bathyarchaeia archaeon]